MSVISASALLSGCFGNSSGSSQADSGGGSAIVVSGPVLREVQRVDARTRNFTPNYIFNSSAEGKVSYSGDCASRTGIAAVGDNEIIFEALELGTHNNCRIKVTDSAGDSTSLQVSEFVIDRTPPSLAEVRGVPSFINTHRPSYTFSTTEAGTISYNNGCPASLTQAEVGENTIIFNHLFDLTHRSCRLQVTDAAGNSSSLKVSDFTVDTTAIVFSESNALGVTGDSTPDYRFFASEAGSLSYQGDCVSELTQVGRRVHDIVLRASAGGLSDGLHSNCQLIATDRANNVSTFNITPFTVDTVKPLLSESSAVVTPTSDRTPSYGFTTTEAGGVSYGGGCSGWIRAGVGLNNITLGPLNNGTYSSCTVRVTDVAGNVSLPLDVTDFEIDSIAPTLTEQTPIAQRTNDTTPSYTFYTDSAGTISYEGVCSSTTQSSVANSNNTITFNTLLDGLYDDCTIEITDGANNKSGLLRVRAFTIDTVAPNVNEITAVSTPGNDNTPLYRFSSTETGSVVSGGGCPSTPKAVTVNNNAITFQTLLDATYSSCYLEVSDEAGNTTRLSISSFIVDTQGPTLSVDTAIAEFGRNRTPSFSFNSSEVGTIIYDGGCSSLDDTADADVNTISLETLGDGYYNTCSLQVIDRAGNDTTLNIAAFTIDNVKPILTERVVVVTPNNISTPSYRFHSNEIGSISYATGSPCTSTTTLAVANDNNLTFASLNDGDYSNCSLRVTDRAGNASDFLAIPAFTIDTVRPSLSETTAVSTPSRDRTPEYIFSSTEAGRLSYQGGCESTDEASSGENHIDFDLLADGNYHDCRLQVTDLAGNASDALDVTDFTVTKIINPLNDTGVSYCTDYAYTDTGTYATTGSGTHNSYLNCALQSGIATKTAHGTEVSVSDGLNTGGDVIPAGQDVHYGRDSDNATNSNEDGHAGFSFIKLDSDGNPLSDQTLPWDDNGSEAASTQWRCVKDNVTEIIWEIKTDNGGLQDTDWTYTWYDSSGVNTGGNAGTSDGGNNCYDSGRCDTEKYVADINTLDLCGESSNDWRLPTAHEMMGIVNFVLPEDRRDAPVKSAIDQHYFPRIETSGPVYWTSTTDAASTGKAWDLQFDLAISGTSNKSALGSVRLVRSP